MTRLADRTIAVIGGGIGGLTAALAFAKAGARVTVYEQAPALTEVGAGLQITPNGARVLNALGLSEKLRAIGITAQAVQPMNAVTGATIARFDLTSQSPAYRFYHRADLLGALAEACAIAGVILRLGARVTDVALDGSFSDGGTRVFPKLTVGADGIRSVVRPLLNGAEEPFFTGQVAWRAMIAAPAQPMARIWMSPGRHVVTYPIRDGRLNIVAVQERKAWAEEGWHKPDDPSNLRAAFADACPDLTEILAAVDGTNIWGLYRHPVAACWGNGQVALLGDAAHPTLPFLAQGANLAIEDAWVLVSALSSALDDKSGLQAYENGRQSRVSRAIRAANANARQYHLGGLSARAAHLGLNVLGKVAPTAFLGRLSWLYDHDVTAQTYQFAAV